MLNDILTKLDEFKTYSQSRKPQFSSQYEALMSPLYAAVNTYFSTEPKGMKDALENYVHQSYCDTWERGVKYENPIAISYPTDYPEEADDIRKCFYQFPLLEVSKEAFFGAWVESAPEGGEEGVPASPEPVSNSLVDQWVPEILAAPDEDVKRIEALNDWYGSCGSSACMVNLLEDQGLILDAPDTQEVARMIYIDHHLLEVIEDRKFNVYIPTYLRT